MVVAEAGELDAIKMLDSGANFPGPGVLADLNLLHHPGSYSGCLNINTDNPDTQLKERETISLIKFKMVFRLPDIYVDIQLNQVNTFTESKYNDG